MNQYHHYVSYAVGGLKPYNPGGFVKDCPNLIATRSLHETYVVGNIFFADNINGYFPTSRYNVC